MPHSVDSAPTFAELGVAAEIVDALAQAGITRTFAIQELAIPLALSGRDLIGQARTGMGKTFGFGVPLLDRVFDDADIAELDGTPRALVIVPTRELAVQVGDDLTMAARHTPIRVTTIYGGRPYEDQVAALGEGVDVVVGTPGRLIDLYERGDLTLSAVAILVLDEADEMLDMGFLPDIQKLWSALPSSPAPLQSMLFSATMPGPILTLARTLMRRPVNIRAESGDAAATHATTNQVVFRSHRMDKLEVTARVLQATGRGRTIIFARTKRTAADVAQDLGQRGFSIGSVHGDMSQEARERSLDAFRRGAVDILVATDVAARGIDVDDVTHVINFQTPDDPMTYVHRIGRTGRAGRTGTAVTLVGFDETRKWAAINDELGLGMAEPPEWFSTSPELYDALSIPTGASGSVGPARAVLGSPARKARKR
ncbi:DEAD-box ATP-dependent RNA helicase CshA [Corynebacterium capitovis DSM 44611]|uniref:DEAD/DEAH box helicase n=1 Tax=Corynebacterium capitovis TaxID=131081 RepID=UPI000366C2BC|nr:DEAD/DEAH box helicase [Corynebacterium capitovis]WKD57054.1 DEAD-box ATP-dependent RNA helicase CshA [Corynebacterium capitovis DSM 44611]